MNTASPAPAVPKVKISVVCVTKRKGAAEFLQRQLAKQTFKDFEVIVADDSGDAKITGWKHFVPRQKEPGDVWNLNKAYNDCLDKVEGELIVFLQDFIWVSANGLQRFWDLYQFYPDSLITGVGHKYTDGTFQTLAEIDERVLNKESLTLSNPTAYEINWASCPTKIAPRFNESMDRYYGGENQVFAFNAKAPVWIDKLNQCKGIVTERPPDWEEKHFNKIPTIPFETKI